jgi:hypothetical protein
LPRDLLGLPLLEDGDRQWVARRYPGLTVDGDSVRGTVEINATYNAKADRFQILRDGVEDTVGGLRLAGGFSIEIRVRSDVVYSRLPALYVRGMEATADRHFSQQDKSACLCSPLEEDDFLLPNLNFQKFFEELVVPFLYGQLFYSKEGYWPWTEYAHGATGLLESYLRVGDPAKAQTCLSKLALDVNWPRIRSALMQRGPIKGHTPCFCPKMDFIRRCHPDAWKGIRELRDHIESQSIPVP